MSQTSKNTPWLTINSVSHHPGLLYHLRACPAANNYIYALLWTANMACYNHTLLGRNNDWLWFCERLEDACRPSFDPRRPGGQSS